MYAFGYSMHVLYKLEESPMKKSLLVLRGQVGL